MMEEPHVEDDVFCWTQSRNQAIQFIQGINLSQTQQAFIFKITSKAACFGSTEPSSGLSNEQIQNQYL
jgi:hypothetical protein